MTAAYILGGCRTPIGKMLGGLSTVPAPQLGATAISNALERTQIAPSRVEEAIMGIVLSAGVGQAPARQAALYAGLPDTVAALTVNKMCASGLKAVMLADQVIRAGDADVIVAGGMENMSLAPHLIKGGRSGWKFGNQQLLDTMLHDGLWCSFDDRIMGSQADYIATEQSIAREDQDAFAAESHRRALEAAERMDEEIVPVTVSGRKGETVVRRDEGPRSDSTVDLLAGLRPAFSSEGTVTAGNASQISDGAAAVVVASERVAREYDSPLRARIVASATSGVAPKDIFIAPVSAIRRVLEKARMSLADIDLVELNEAFASQCLACMRPLELEHEKTNVRGGAIALGHPIGASGARVLVTLLYAMAERGARRGLASLCLGGGNAVAMIVEREEA